MIDLIDWAQCMCFPEEYPEEEPTNPRCPEQPKGSCQVIQYDANLEELITDLEDEWLARLPEDRPALAEGVREAFSK